MQLHALGHSHGNVLAPRFPKFYLPDAFELIDAIPCTSAGKFKKRAPARAVQGYQLAE
jgi:non-ribosomal peptide synthetase component E (peptide arylation enzyme)